MLGKVVKDIASYHGDINIHSSSDYFVNFNYDYEIVIVFVDNLYLNNNVIIFNINLFDRLTIHDKVILKKQNYEEDVLYSRIGSF